jgi:hypothetical protein
MSKRLDDMESQSLFNLSVGIAGTLGGWCLKTIWDSVKDLQKADKELAEKVASIEVLVAGKYITRDEFTAVVNMLSTKLDNIKDAMIHKGP